MVTPLGKRDAKSIINNMGTSRALTPGWLVIISNGFH